jgi:hypothetical protein
MDSIFWNFIFILGLNVFAGAQLSLILMPTAIWIKFPLSIVSWGIVVATLCIVIWCSYQIIGFDTYNELLVYQQIFSVLLPVVSYSIIIWKRWKNYRGEGWW